MLRPSTAAQRVKVSVRVGVEFSLGRSAKTNSREPIVIASISGEQKRHASQRLSAAETAAYRRRRLGGAESQVYERRSNGNGVGAGQLAR